MMWPNGVRSWRSYEDDLFPRRVLLRAVRWSRRRRLRRERATPRRLSRSPLMSRGTVTSARINRLLRRRHADYLEIGVWRGETLEAVAASRRVGVDPEVHVDAARLPRGVEFHRASSDEYFRGLDGLFDAILVDGLHEAAQAYRDIRNALIHLEPDGFVLVDDVIPPDECAAEPSEEAARACTDRSGSPWLGVWTGDVFRAVWSLVSSSSGLDHRTIVEGIGENPQTLLWWAEYPRDLEARRSLLRPEIGEGAHLLTWVDEFRSGPPSWLRPARLKEAEVAFRAATAGSSMGS